MAMWLATSTVTLLTCDGRSGKQSATAGPNGLALRPSLSKKMPLAVRAELQDLQFRVHALRVVLVHRSFWLALNRTRRSV